MSNGFDPNAFLGTAPAGSSNSNFDPNSFIDQHSDPVTGGDRPAYADGLSPQSPLNKSPVDVTDRIKYAFGNKEGIVKDLKTKFEDVTQDKYGNYIVKSQGLWHRVDPKGLGDGDPWQRTKELVADAADVVPKAWAGAAMGATTGVLAGALAGGVGAAPGAVAGAIIGGAGAILSDAGSEEIQNVVEGNTGKLGTAAAILGAAGVATKEGRAMIKGVGIPAAVVSGGAELARTSLGRLVGTYDATPEQQLKDVGLEALMTLGGETISAGVKPTFKMLAKAGNALVNLPSTSKDVVANGLGTMSPAGASNIRTYLDEAPQVNKWFSLAKADAKQNGEDLEKTLTRQGIEQVKMMANDAPKANSAIYRKFQGQILNSVDDNFKSSADDVSRALYMNFEQGGLGQFVKDVPQYAEQGLKGPMTTQRVALDEIAKHAADGKTFLPEGVRFELKPLNQILKEQADTGIVQELANDQKSYRYIRDLYNFAKQYEGSTELKGKQGALEMLKLKQTFGNKFHELIETSKDENITHLSRFFSAAEDGLDMKFTQAFDKATNVPGLYSQMNQEYSTGKKGIQALLVAKRLSEKQASDAPYETLFKQISAVKPDSNLVKKDALVAAVKMSKEAGMSSIEDSFNNIRHIQVARSFVPWAGGSMTKYSLGAAGGALLSGNPLAATGFGIGAAASSPRMNKIGIDAMKAIGGGASNMIPQPANDALKTTVETAFRGLDWLKRLPPAQVKAVASNPAIMQSLFSTIATTGIQQKTMTDQLVGNALQSTMPTPPAQMEPPQKGGK
jgi:hypothetical protein